MNFSALLFLSVSVVGTRMAWRRGARGYAAAGAALALLFGASLWQSTHPILRILLLVVAAAAAWHRYGSTFAVVGRWGSAIRRKSGVASSLDIARHAGPSAMRRRGPTMRPSLRRPRRAQRCWQRVTLPPAEVAVRLCRVGLQTAWCAMEEVVLIIGGPRKGKTQILAGQVIDAPGAVIATSTRTDLLDQTGPLRAQRGPVFVFNPVGLGSRPSTVTFDPLTGCENPVTAAERAMDMLAAGQGYGGRSGDREFWDDQGRRNLAALLHAAALAGDLTMADVGKWLSNLDANAAQITGLLRRSPEPAYEASVTQFIATNLNTRSSIAATISPALAWLTHGPARAAALPARAGGRPIDVARLLAERGTVYMLGGEEAAVAPLVCAMTGWIAREARRLAAHCPDGRLDPPLALRLDECALICKVPLHQWTADMGGRGVSIVACFQSRSQIVDHYGAAKAATIINNAGAKALFGGTGDRDDLQYWSTLAGERDERITTTDMHGRVASRTVRRVPVLAPAQIHTLPPGRVVVFTSAMPPVIGQAEKAFRRSDVRAAHAPDALTVRGHAWAARTGRRVGVWAWRHALTLAAVALGLLVGGPQGAAAAVAAGHAPGWAGALAGGFLGVAVGLLAAHLLALAWRDGRPPTLRWLRWRCAPALAWTVGRWAWVVARWAWLRRRVTGADPDAGYHPFGISATPADPSIGRPVSPWAPPAPDTARERPTRGGLSIVPWLDEPDPDDPDGLTAPPARPSS